MCDCFGNTNSHSSQPKRAVRTVMPELEYIPIDDSYISSKRFRSKLQNNKSKK
jgi:hypothetical protein